MNAWCFVFFLEALYVSLALKQLYRRPDGEQEAEQAQPMQHLVWSFQGLQQLFHHGLPLVSVEAKADLQ